MLTLGDDMCEFLHCCYNPPGDEARGMCASTQYHRTSTSGKHYNLRPAKSIALKSKEILITTQDGLCPYPTEEERAALNPAELVGGWRKKFCRTKKKASAKIPEYLAKPTQKTMKTSNKFLFFTKDLPWPSGTSFTEECHPTIHIPGGEGVVQVTRAQVQARAGERPMSQEITYSITAGAHPPASHDVNISKPIAGST